MKNTILILSASVFLLASCGGVDADLVASGKSHQCNINRVSKLLEADPESEELASELEEYKGYYETIIDCADEGGKSALEEAIQEAAKEGCD